MSRPRALAAALLAALVLAPLPARAHIGSPDVFYEGEAGPYRLLVTIRPPSVVPGVAEVQIRSTEAGASEVRIVPLLMAGPGSEHAPVPDVAQRSKEDPQFFTGALWLMTAGAWQVRITVSGDRGNGELSVPVPALPERTLGMQPALAVVLAALALLLVLGIVSLAGAWVREGALEPGEKPGKGEKRRAWCAMAIAGLLVAGALHAGNLWWDACARSYDNYVYKPVQLWAGVENGKLVLRLGGRWGQAWNVDDIVPDHAHLMHLFVVRLPEMEKLWHLHPDRRGPGEFVHAMPAMPAGRYALFADIVHRTGLAETGTTELRLDTASPGQPLEGDDSQGEGPALSRADTTLALAPLEGGGRVIWDRPASLRAKETQWLRFDIQDDWGKPAEDVELYMGMLGHLAILERERTVFAHIHPSGSVSMGALALLQPEGSPSCHDEKPGKLPARVSFPYGFPKPGDYRLFLQVKRGGKVRTATFDARVE